MANRHREYYQSVRNNPELWSLYLQKCKLRYAAKRLAMGFGPKQKLTPWEMCRDRYVPEPNTGCWLWLGFVGTDGYGRVSFRTPKGVSRSAHRFFYTMRYGEIPLNLQIDHKCRVRSCVNPDHLEAVSARENVLRGIGLTANNARKLKCPNGHEYGYRKIGNRSRAARYCWRCQTATAKERERRKQCELQV